MSTKVKSGLHSLIGIGVWVVLLSATACQGEPGPSNATWEAPSGREPNA